MTAIEERPLVREAVPTIDVDSDQTFGQRLRSTWRDARDFRALKSSPYRLVPLLTLGLISFLQAFDTRAFDLAGPDIARDLGISVGDIITIQVLIGTLAAFASLYAGWMGDRHRRVPMVSIGTIVSGIASVFTGRGRSFTGVSTPRMINTMADVGSGVPRFSLLADYYPHEVRGKAFALLGTIYSIARLTAPVLVGYMLLHIGWESTFVIIGIPLALAGVLSWFTLREPVRGYFERKAMGLSEEEAVVEDEPQSFAEAARATWSVRTVRRLTFGDAFAVGAGDIVGLFIPFFLAERYGLDPLERGFLFVPAVLCSLVGGLIGGALVDRLTRINPSRVLLVFAVASLILAPEPIIYYFELPLPAIVLIACMGSFGGSLIGPATSVVYAQVIPSNIRTFGLQFTNLAAVPTTILFLPITRVLFRDYGYEAVWLFCIPLAIIGALFYISAAGFFELDMRNALAATVAADEWRLAKAAGTAKLLVARDVDVAYDGVQVLFGVDLDIDEGEIVALLGTNGAGKSSLLRALCGLTEASGGAIVFDGRDITHMPAYEIASRGIVQMPGGRGIFPGLTVRENLLLGTWLGDDHAENQARVDEVLTIFPSLRERPEVLARDLSGGQQQQLSLAQAFLIKPRVLLIDELSLGLAPTVVAQLIEVVRELNRRGVTIIVVEQSVNVALTIADRAIFMEKGEIRFDGRSADLLARPDILRSVYVKGTGGAGLTDSATVTAPPASEGVVLEVSGLAKRFGGVVAVDNVSFELRDGEVLGLIGPNGAGKTTIFDIISGHQTADAGHVLYEGVDITTLSPDERARRRLIRRFQDARLFPSLTVFETLLVALEQRLEVRSTLLNAIAAPQARRAERRLHTRADKLIELLELGAYRDKLVRELSTGLRRIVDLACVLGTEPKVLLLDEPSTGIAQAESEGLGPLLRRVRFETGCSMLIIEHDMSLISAVSDELIAFDLGSLVVRGTPNTVLNDERVIESYLGTSESVVNRSGRSS